MLSFIKKYQISIRVTFSLLVIVAVIYFIGTSLIDNWVKLRSIDIKFSILSVLGIACFVASVLSTGYLWGNVLERLAGKNVDKTQAIRAQIASWLLKYIPGQVGSLTGKLTWGMRHGYDKKTISISFIYENVMLVAASTIPTLPILVAVFLGHIHSSLSLVLPFLVVAPMLVLIWQPVFYRVVNKSLSLVKKKPLEKSFFLSDFELGKFFFKFLLPRILIAAGFIAIAQTVAPVEPRMYLGMGAAYIIAGVIGILVLFVPSGLGVREGILVLLLSIYFPFEIAFVMAALARVYTTISDILLAIIYLALTRKEARA